MHARNVLLFASVLLPVIGAPVATQEVRLVLSSDEDVADMFRATSSNNVVPTS
jgi:hypothetical protein